MNYLNLYVTDLIRRFRAEDEGLALTEYLVVLGLLIGGVIGAVLIFGQNLSAAWTNWGTWIQTMLGATPPTT